MSILKLFEAIVYGLDIPEGAAEEDIRFVVDALLAMVEGE